MERAVQVRTVDGQSTVVRISPERTVGELQEIIKESFSPAKEFPNFRLFYKGAQLRTESSLRSYLIDERDFVVLVPFVKRTRGLQKPESQTNGGAESSKRHHQVENSTPADSAWMEMMEDLRSLQDSGSASSMGNFVPESRFNPIKSNRTESCLLFLGNFLRNNKYVLDSLPKAQECSPDSSLADCLSDPDSGNCYFSIENCRTDGDFDLCTCPVWLKKLVKCFSFLNAAHSFLLMQHRGIEWQCLRQALECRSVHQIDEFSIIDVEHLMLLCPKLVMLGNQKTLLSHSKEAVVILDCSEEPILQPKQTYNSGAHSSHASSAFSRQKREVAFKELLFTMIKSATGRIESGSTMPSLSLDDIISFRETCEFSDESRSTIPKNRSPVLQNNTECLCQATTALRPLEMVDHLKHGLGVSGQIVHIEEFRAKTAVYAELPRALSEITKSAFHEMGISRLYSHQADAICASLSGKNVVISTSTSSGKSLCYNIPVLEELHRNSLSCALYIFPTKALAQDQLRALVEMTRMYAETIDIGVYDGDTPQHNRASIQNSARLLITNPDMLHASILPFHEKFKRILSNLRFIIIDEAHAYKGAFGCHTSLILRRLCRICSHVYGSIPSFIFCTATSANPREHVMELGNLENVELISNDGSPCGPKLFLLWNPPLRNIYESKNRGYKDKSNKNEMIGRRTSPIYEVSCLVAEMVQHSLRCIAFCKSRKLCELILCYTREILGKIDSDLVDMISVYRAGYTAKDRRCIENDLFGGELRGIVATNALELGIDVGHIDATLHLGFPGSFASFWQQAGRSGRRLQPSLSIYVAFEGPIDQYFMKLPKKLFENPIEHCHVDASNAQVIEQHITCAALEHPLCIKFDEKFFGNCLQNSILTLQSRGYLAYNSSCDIWNYIGPERRPSLATGIRAIETEIYVVVDISSNKILEEIEESKAFFSVYDGAVYINQGATYLVQTLDLSKKMAFCQKADLKYYTRTRDNTEVHVFGGNLAYPPSISENETSKSMLQCQQCRVKTVWFGFYRIRRGSNQIIDSTDLSLPPYSYKSTAVSIQISRLIKASVEARGFSFRAGQHAAVHALLNLAPLYIMCNASDLSTECANPNQKRDIPDRLLLYDEHPGGMGISVRLRPLFMELLKDALRLVTSCRCVAGCPDCVQNVRCREYNEVLDKEAAIAILEGILAERQ